MVQSKTLRGCVMTVTVLSLLACAPSPEKAEEQPKPTPAEAAKEKQPAVTPKPRVVPAEKPAAAPKPLPEQQNYVILADASDVRIFVYRTGRLASRIGHNHVISSPDVHGTMTLKRGVTGSTVDIGVPVATLVVDDPEKRKQAGSKFETEISEQDIEGTRRNMLSSRVLDAGQFPLVTIQATVTGGQPPDLQADVSMTLHGKVQQFQTPVKFRKEGMLATATGGFTIRQTDFGIEPFSMLGGALAVKDEVEIQYSIVARPKE